MDSEALDFLAELEEEEKGIVAREPAVPSGPRACPVCKKPMVVEIEYGIHVDVCPAHGLWLDRGELPRIISKVRSGDRIHRTQAIRKARRDGKVSGALFGVWSLLLD